MRSEQALILVDMQRGFLEDGYPLFCGSEAREIIPVVRRTVEEAFDQGIPVFFTADVHDPDDREFAIYPPHCIRGTEEAKIIPELASYLDHGTLIETVTYSAFYETDLHRRLQGLGVEELIFCGVCTDICVLHTAADAYFRGYRIAVRRDGVASFDPDAHRFGLRHMETAFGARLIGEER